MPFTLLATSPLGSSDIELVRACSRAGALGVLDVTGDRARAFEAISEAAARIHGELGVRVDDARLADRLPPAVSVVVVADAALVSPYRALGRRVFVEVCSLGEALRAHAAGADVLIAKGSESGGRVGDASAFVLLQQLAAAGLGVPLFLQGGIGVGTAAAAFAGGAAGVVLDIQLSLLAESALDERVKAALRKLDGTETTVVDGRRVHRTFESSAVPRSALAGLPLGQDAALAKPLADRYRTVGRLVRSIARAVPAHVRLAKRLRPLAPDSELARTHATRYPIVQGPMTRVSDSPCFAAAVAEAGALPFVALAMLRGAEIRSLLQEVRERLGARSWGVGLLGFAPLELREEQLEAIEALRPPYALIAGGQPGQAKRLERAGIETYLHVPSPALLDTFLKEGLRRFVFEGSECGGHIGPRSSFVLWELVIERLLKHEEPQALRLLFAGGVHDARSAAMIAALTAPLVARGAQVGVLMGTAYLFSREAVSSGAITDAYQQAALSCQDTALLQTGPGHVIRAAPSPYMEQFAARRDELAQEGHAAERIWAELETFNLGRLRLAAKGVRREGSALTSVDTAAQQRDGLFMIGQVACLRTGVTDLASLHRNVCEDASEQLEEVALPSQPGPERSMHVAIVGISCVFPHARDAHSYFGNVLAAADCVEEVPDERWNKAIYYDPRARPDSGKSASKWGCFIPEIDFEPDEFGIPPRSIPAIDPAQLLALKVAKAALDDAGLGGHNPHRETTSVIFAASTGADLAGAYRFRTLYPGWVGELPEELAARLPVPSEDTFPGTLANVIAGRISNRLDLRGANYTVDAACASSLAAVDLACRELLLGTSDVALAGAVDLHNAIEDYANFTSVQALSPTGRCRPFDSAADGIALGEGVAVVVLKRLDDALRDGDRVYAVIRGVGSSSDGRCLGLTAPRPEGQRLAIERAYDQAGFQPDELTMVEAHGTGTVVGDLTELSTLTDTLLDAGAPHGACALGSVKSSIGHTKAAAGLAGLIKVALSIHHRVLPPTRSLESPNAYYRAEHSPFVFRDRPAPWTSPRRRAGVSAMGFGGTNFHVALEDSGLAATGSCVVRHWPFELIVLRGADRAAAEATARRLVDALQGAPEISLRELAASLCALDEGHPVQLATVVDSAAMLGQRLKGWLAARSDDGVFTRDEPWQGQLALMFPGQGSQRTHMLGDLLARFPELQRWSAGAASLISAIYPPAAFTSDARDRQRAALRDTRSAQPALGLVGLAMARILDRLELAPFATAGHSYGELTALAYAGAIDPDALLSLSALRAQAMLSAAGDDPGTMAAVRGSSERVRDAVSGLSDVVIANYNGPRQTVIAGSQAAVEAAVARCEGAGLATQLLNVACAFHSPVIAGADQLFADALRNVEVKEPRLPVWSNTTAAPHGAAEAIRETLALQLVSAVRFEEQVRSMYAAGVRTFVEVAPGRALTGLIGQILDGMPHRAIALDDPGGDGLRALLEGLGKLAAAGAPMRLSGLFDDRVAAPRPLETILVPTSRHAWRINGHRARPSQPDSPIPHMRPILAPIAVATAAPAGNAEVAVLEFLRGTRELVETQRQVLMQFLHGDPSTSRGTRSLPSTESSPAAARRAHDAVPSLPLESVSTDTPGTSASDPLAVLLEIISDRTGYPVEMIEPTLDLDADLGIDSIKRMEILNRLNERLELWRAEDDERGSSTLDQLSRLKSAAAIVEWITVQRGSAPSAAPAPLPRIGRALTEPMAAANDALRRQSVTRLVPTRREIACSGTDLSLLAGQRIGIVRDASGVAEALHERLSRAGFQPVITGVQPTTDEGDCDVWFVVHCLDAARGQAVKDLFRWVQAQITRAAPACVIFGTGQGGDFSARHESSPGAGVAGFVKTLAKELPGSRVCIVDLNPREAPAELAEHLLAEACARDGLVEIGWRERRRSTLDSVPSLLEKAEPRVALGPGSVIVVTGGARGITAQTTIALARRFGCSFELLGRTAARSEPEPREIIACTDASSLRRALAPRLAAEGKSMQQIEAECSSWLAERERRATLEAVTRAGGRCSYRSVDVRDEAALSRAIEDIYREHGRIDGVIHGAGVIEDKAVADKSWAAFERVFDTKVSAAETLLECLRDDVRFVAFFSSVSAVFGTRGQLDYAAANAYLDDLATARAGSPLRTLSVNWGPWSGTGMVSTELERAYRAQGIGLISVDDGTEAFIDELIYGDLPRVILTSAPAAEQLDVAE